MKRIIILVLVVFNSGCASVNSRMEDGYSTIDKGVYPGVRGDIEWLTGDYRNSELQGAEGIIYPLAFIDLPIAVALDTILLPADLIEQYSKIQKVKELAKKYLPNYKIIENAKSNKKSRFALISTTGERIEFEKMSSDTKLSNFIKKQGITVSTELEAQEIVQLVEMIILGDIEIVKNNWHYQVDRKDNSWEVSIRNNNGGRLGNIWILETDESNKLKKIMIYMGF